MQATKAQSQSAEAKLHILLKEKEFAINAEKNNVVQLQKIVSLNKGLRQRTERKLMGLEQEIQVLQTLRMTLDSKFQQMKDERDCNERESKALKAFAQSKVEELAIVEMALKETKEIKDNLSTENAVLFNKLSAVQRINRKKEAQLTLLEAKENPQPEK